MIKSANKNLKTYCIVTRRDKLD